MKCRFITKGVFIAVCSFLFASFNSVYGQVAGSDDVQPQDSVVLSNLPSYVADEVVAVVGSSMILLSELNMTEQYINQSYIEQGYTIDNARAEALESLLMQKLLATRAAIDSLEVNEQTVSEQTEQQMNAIVRMRGSVKDLEVYYNKPIYSIKEDIRYKIKEAEMARLMQTTVKHSVIMTPAEIIKYYKKIDKDSLPLVPDQYVYAQITKEAPRGDVEKLNVKEELLDMRRRILEGTSFQVLARMYSEDPGSSTKGGEMAPQVPEGFVAPFAEALKALTPGQVSDVVETEFGYHLIQLIDVNQGLYHSRHILRKIKFEPEELDRAVVTLDSVASLIRSDSISFKSAVEQFSDDIESKLADGMVANKNVAYYGGVRMKSNKFYKEDIGPDFDRIRLLKEGDVSSAFVSLNEYSDEIVKVIKLLEIIPSHRANLDDDYMLLEDLALAQKQNEHFEKWLNDRIAEIYVKIEDRYKDIPIRNKNWLK